MSEVGKLWVTVGMKDSELSKGLQSAEQKVQATAQKFQQIGGQMTKFVTLPILALFAGMGKAAMDLEATAAKYDTVFAGMTDTVDDFIKEFQRLTPATTAEARSMYSGVQDLLVPMGFMREEATALTGEFMHAAGALTNFNSGTHTAADVTGAMQSALSGMYMPLRSLGINIDKTTVDLKAMEMGLADASGEVSKQAAAQATLALIYENSTDALDAYNEESLDAKTRMGLLKAEVVDMAAKFGELLLPLINAVIGALRGFVSFLDKIPGPIRVLVMGILALAAAAGPFLLILGKFMTMLPLLKIGIATLAKLKMGALVPAFLASAKAAWAFTAALLANPITWIVLAIVALIAVIVLLAMNWDKIVEAFKIGWEAIKGAGSAVWDWFKDLPAKFLQWGKDIINNIWEGIKATWEKLKKGIADIGQAIKDFFNPFKKSSPSLVELVQSGTHKIMEAYQGIEVPRMNVQQAAVAGVSAGGGGTTNNYFSLKDIHVRDDRDIEKIALELYSLQTRRDRGV